MQSEFNYAIYGAIPDYAVSKTHLSAEARYEVYSVQGYVAALAEYDLQHSAPVALVAAFDEMVCSSSLHATTHSAANVTVSVYRDLAAFFSPAQRHVHHWIAQMPLSWGDFSSLSVRRVDCIRDYTTHLPPPTLWLTARLLAGGRHGRGLPTSRLHNDGSGTGVAGASSDSFSTSLRPAPTSGAALESSSDDEWMRSLKRSRRIYIPRGLRA